MADSENLSAILERVDVDDRAVMEELLRAAYTELRALAGSFFRQQRPGHTLEPTALVHEAFVKLTNGTSIKWESRKHFFMVAGHAMRQVLIDHARRRNRDKRGAGWQRVTLSGAIGSSTPSVELDVVELEAALSKLEQLNERHARIVELRFLTGLSIEDVADVLGVSRRTVELDWRQARAWLRSELTVE